jgi:predicted dehydrogenase
MFRFAIVGAGWRSEFFLRIARELPEKFEVTGILSRRPERAAELRKTWPIRIYDSIEQIVADRPDFAITSVSWDSNPVVIKELTDRGIPVLSETPPAPDVPRMVELNELVKRGARIQVAEQYCFQPLHAARIKLVRSGKLGEVFQAQVSVCHGYHGISLIRRLLGIGYEPAKIAARTFPEVVVGGPDRNGHPPTEERLDRQSQLVAHLDFGDKQAVFDFVGSMYHSSIRSHRMLVRGPRGEINSNDVRYLEDFRTPIEYRLRRVDAGQTGNLDGHFLQGVLGGSEWLYRNPFPFARLMDDEIAIAECMWKMGEYAHGGPDFYSLAEASQDHYLSLLMNEAAELGLEVKSVLQPWASGVM